MPAPPVEAVPRGGAASAESPRDARTGLAAVDGGEPLRAAAAWTYEVRSAEGDPGELRIEATFAPGSDAFAIDDDVGPFVRDVAYAAGGAWRAAQGNGVTFRIPCTEAACRVRYRFALRQAAEALEDAETATAVGDAWVAPPSTWLLRPAQGAAPIDPHARFRFHVVPAAGTRFAAGTRPAPDGAADTFEADVDALDDSSFAVFGSFDDATVENGAARVEIATARRGLTLSAGDVVGWVRTSVDNIAAYLGRFPAPRTLVVVAAAGSGSTRGETLGDGGPGVFVRVGNDVKAASLLRNDWVLTHELLHVSMPSMGRAHAWLEEGMASYVEPIVRVRAGLITPEKFWGDLVQGLPQGLPEAGDEGLERTHTWGRTYWGGALFCLMADVDTREKTDNARSLDDALRGIVQTGADVEVHWDVARWIAEGDRATGTQVLANLYRDMAVAPGTVDLPALWSRLGVRLDRQGVHFDDRAPLALVRRAISGRR